MKDIKPVIKGSKRFETIKIRLVFPFIEKEEDIVYDTLLPKMLNYMCQKYPTEESFKKAKLEKYIISCHCHCSVLGTSGFFCFNLSIPDVKILSNQELEDAVSFLSEVVYKPKIINNGFDKFELTREINNLKLDIDNSQKYLRGYIANKIPNLVDNVGIYKRGVNNKVKEIDQVTPAKLYKFYQKNIQSKSPYCFAYGNVNKKFLNNLFKKYFGNKEVNCFKSKINYFLQPFREKPQIIVKQKDFKQSAVCLVFKITNYSNKDKVALNLVGSLLRNSTTNLLFNKLRIEEGLVYSADVLTKSRYGLLELRAFMDDDKLEYAKDKMLEIINDLKNERKINPLLKILNEDYKVGMIEDKDDNTYLLDIIMDQYFHIGTSSKKAYKKRKRCKAKDISKLVKRLKLDTILYVKENKNAK